MDRAFVDEVLALLGARYKLGAAAGSAVELSYRAGRAEFRPSRFLVGAGESGRGLELTVDVRIPKDTPAAQAEALIAAFETSSAAARGFVRIDQSTAKMTSERGEDHGSVMTLRYKREPAGAAETAKQIRAIVETIDIPIVVGIHEAEHVVAKEAPPHREKHGRPIEQMENWEYRLEGGLARSLTVVINPNDRTLRVVERKLFSKRELGELLKLAHVAKFRIVARDGAAELVAVKKDGSEVSLAKGSRGSELVATAGRMAKKVMIAIE
jgi:hypothetical protein